MCFNANNIFSCGRSEKVSKTIRYISIFGMDVGPHTHLELTWEDYNYLHIENTTHRFCRYDLKQEDRVPSHLRLTARCYFGFTSLRNLYIYGSPLGFPIVHYASRLNGLTLNGVPDTCLDMFLNNVKHFLSLENLTIRECNLKQFPPAVCSLTKLSNLFLSLPDTNLGTLKHFSHLRILTMTIMQLNQVPDAVPTLTTLHKLDLSYNLLNQVPDAISTLKTLHELDLSSNLLRQVPDAILTLTTLHKLDLSYNLLTDLPPEMSHLASLTDLRLSGCPFVELPPCLSSLTRLKHLYLKRKEHDPDTSLPRWLPSENIYISNREDLLPVPYPLLHRMSVGKENHPYHDEVTMCKYPTVHTSMVRIGGPPTLQECAARFLIKNRMVNCNTSISPSRTRMIKSSLCPHTTTDKSEKINTIGGIMQSIHYITQRLPHCIYIH